MTNAIKELMTSKLVTLPESTPVNEAAKQMKDHDVGDVLLTDEHGNLSGILTDRDIVVRVLADDQDARQTPCINVCTRNPQTLSPNDEPQAAIDLMRKHAVRRIPIVKDRQPVGLVSLGDLAIERDKDSVLGEISAASPTA